MRTTIIAIAAALLLVLPAVFCQADENRDHICFRTLDADGDGLVTYAEFEKHYGKSEEWFRAADANKDGQLTHAEYHVSLGHGAS